MHYPSWCSLSDEELAKRDIAFTNLCSTLDTPDCSDLDLKGLCRKCDDWANLVADYTKRGFRKWRHNHRDLTDGQFRMLALVTVLQRDLGVTYNMAFMEGDGDASNPHDMFLHGLLTGHGGTCVTMPTLYTAIGRRLGYPLFLVHAKEHRFCRWDGQDDRFNVEATCRGFVTRTDEHYLRDPKPLDEIDLATGLYLRNLSRREELAAFLGDRASCAVDNFDTLEAMKACHYACELTPRNGQLQLLYAISTLVHRFVEAIREQGRGRESLAGVYMPEPKEEWERRVYPEAFRHLQRILNNRQRKRLRAEGKDPDAPPRRPELSQLVFSVDTFHTS